jgi:hypothetical protein
MKKEVACRPTSISEDLRNPKVKWATPKSALVVAKLSSDTHFRRLRRWLNKWHSLELSLGPGNELIITNGDLIRDYKAKKAKRQEGC